MTKIKLLNWNVNGFRAVLKKNFVDFFETEDFDILSLQETKISDHQVPEEWKKHPNYYSYWNYAVKKGYSGVATFSKKEALSVQMGMGIEEHDQEGRMLTLEYENFYLVNCYTPNSQQKLKRLEYRQEWNQAFQDHCKNLEKKKPVIISGDLNVAHTDIDLANPKSNYNKTPGYSQGEIDGFEDLLKSGFVDTFREFEKEGGHYSWWSYRFKAREKNVGWRIDYFLISKVLRSHLKSAVIRPEILGSDHCPVEICLEF